MAETIGQIGGRIEQGLQITRMVVQSVFARRDQAKCRHAYAVGLKDRYGKARGEGFDHTVEREVADPRGLAASRGLAAP